MTRQGTWPARIALLAAVLLAPAATFSMAEPAPASAPRADAGGGPGAVAGVWVTARDKPGAPYSHVEILEEDGKYGGRIVWLSEETYPAGDPEAGRPKHDRNNPDRKLRDRPLLGLRLMRDFHFDPGDGKWVDGRIYDPQKGKEYRCSLTLKDADTLEIYGYIKVGFAKLGRHTTWTRAPAGD